jgi:dienelactone hydrolase
MTPGSQGDAFNKSVFYLPSAWQATARSNFAELLHDLHAPPSSHGASPSATLKAANEQLRSLSNSCDPLRVVVCGFATGGALASLAAPYVALAYSSADTRLITYGAPE